MIIIGIPHFGVVASEFLEAYEFLRKPTLPHGSPDWVKLSVHRQVVHRARNMIVRQALSDYPEATHLFFLDDDMTPPPDTLQRLLAHDVPIVTGMCVEQHPPHFPTARRKGHGHFIPVTQFCDGLQEIDACVAACLLVKMEVFRTMEPGPWFDFADGLSEDLYFCDRAQRAGYRILLDFDAHGGHLALVHDLAGLRTL